MTDIREFRDMLRDAYHNDPSTRELFEAFRRRQAIVEQARIALADDPEMKRLHRQLMAAAYAYACGRPVPMNRFVDAMH